MLGEGLVLTSDGLGWESIYFEHRRADAFETGEHVIDEHYLMVKLNPLSKTERWIDGRLCEETLRRGARPPMFRTVAHTGCDIRAR